MKCMVFDTETTGFGPGGIRQKLLHNDKEEWDKYLPNWPYLLQLTFIIYDTETMVVDQIYDKYIEMSAEEIKKIEDEIQRNKDELEEREPVFKTLQEEQEPTEEQIKNLEKLSKSINRRYKNISVLGGNLNRWNSHSHVSIEKVNEEFNEALENINYLVAHNINFDIFMMMATAKRDKNNDLIDKYITSIVELTDESKLYCTMAEGKLICNSRYSVSLTNTYNEIFGYKPNKENLHDSLYDVVITLRLFVRIVTGRDICRTEDINGKKYEENSKSLEVRDIIIEVKPEDVTEKIPLEDIDPSIYARKKQSKSSSKKQSKSSSKKRTRPIPEYDVGERQSKRAVPKVDYAELADEKFE